MLGYHSADSGTRERFSRSWRSSIAWLLTAMSLVLLQASSARAAKLNTSTSTSAARPNIVLVMADDQGWGDVGYRGDTELKTPVLDDLAANNLLLERFYAAAPVCSPTRGSVLTGRHPNRFGCFVWGRTLRPEEITIAESLQAAGYATGHFGKWHLGSLHPDSVVCPGKSGFDQWFSSPNFYENDPLMCRNGQVIQTEGEGSYVTAQAAIEFMKDAVARDQPFLTVVWFGSPHSPHIALDEDRRPYAHLPEKLQHFYGEISAMDRAVGQLRKALRDLKIADNTLFWYTSDNGAISVGSTGGLRGGKGNLSEGGIRVPAIIEWPARIQTPRVSYVRGNTVDIFPTVLDVAGVEPRDPDRPMDGVSLLPLIEFRMVRRPKPMGFWTYPIKGTPVRSTQLLEQLKTDLTHDGPAPGPAPDVPIPEITAGDDFPGASAWIDGDWKLHFQPARRDRGTYQLFNLTDDDHEEFDLADQQPARVARMKSQLHRWQQSVLDSLQRKDYPDARD